MDLDKITPNDLYSMDTIEEITHSKDYLVGCYFNHIPEARLNTDILEFPLVDIKVIKEYNNESYTSKTCTRCGKITKIGSKKIFSCPSCGLIMDRDIQGARNIYLRALVDTSVII